ncbi:glycoside hydrolase family 3 C-terminal domain-containing protein [Halenospora varia]|nr:glycoside hydrolase family 3 C-terminal domain-containing protein [Halenospora varia]
MHTSKVDIVGYLHIFMQSAEACAKAKACVTPLNTIQKIAIVMASSFTSDNAPWTAYTNTDGVSGLNFYMYVSAFPKGNANTVTWNRDLITAQFEAASKAYFATGWDVVDGALLGPLGCVPEGIGRQNGAFSLDPLLSDVAASTGPWWDAINVGCMAVMCAMPLVNDTHSCENNQPLSGKLKEELGFPGFVYPNESAQFSSYASANAVLPYYLVGLDTSDLPEQTDYNTYRNVRGNYSSLIRQIGGEGGLPLNKPHCVSLYGSHAGPNFAWSVAGTTADAFEGHLVSGGESSELSCPCLVTPFQSLTQRTIKDDSMIWWIMNNTYSSSIGGQTFGMGGGTGVSPSYANYASASAVCLAFINSWSGEDADRSELSSDAQDEMVLSVADNYNNTIVVVNVSRPRVLDAWIEHENVTAVIYSGLLGQESGNATADVLYGDVNPSGKLIHTIAKNASDYPASVCSTTDCTLSEGAYIYYQWFDKEDIEPRYTFGHGLSYTTSSHGSVTTTITNSYILASKYATGQLGLGGQVDLFDENTGFLDGAEVAQLYVSNPEEASQPVPILRGFEKVNITAGSTSAVSFSLRRRDVSYWDVSA